MADIETSRARGPHLYGAPIVYTKSNLELSNAWIEHPHLYCDSVTSRCNGFSEASFTYHAGQRVLQIGGTEFEASASYNTGSYVRVKHGDFNWYGYIERSKFRRKTSQNATLTAFGLEYWLDRVPIRRTVIYDNKILGRTVKFNAGGAATFNNTPNERGNMSIANNGAGVRVFANEVGSVAEWNAYEMIRYLLWYFGPQTDSNADSPCPYILDPNAADFLSDLKPAFDPDGMTVYEVLNALVSPKRGLCWWLDFSEIAPSGVATIKVQSLTTSEVTLPGGGSIAANTNPKSLNYDNDETVQTDSVSKQRRGRYTQCRARGARITSTMTLDFGTELEKDWKDETETAYKAAASGTTGYSGLSTEEKKSRNDAFRRQEEFYRVYCAYRIPSSWDGEAGGEIAFPESLTGGSEEEKLTHHTNWLRILPKTLLNRGWDYQDVSEPVDNTPTGSGPELMPPFAVLKVASSPDLYQFADKIGNPDYALGTKETDELTTSYHLYIQQDCPGIVMRPSNGLNHMLAKDNFSGAEPTGKDPELDHTYTKLTCSIEADHYCEGVYPSSPEAGQYEELLIKAGDDYRLDYVVPGTIVALNNGAIVDTGAGGLLRDDRDRLKDIARFAFEWYQSEQQTLDVTWSQQVFDFELGMMLTTLGETDPEEINTVVGTITHNWANNTTSITTIGDEFDVRQVI